MTAGIFVSIVAWASYQRENNKTPYWRTLKVNGELNSKYPGGIEKKKEISLYFTVYYGKVNETESGKRIKLCFGK